MTDIQKPAGNFRKPGPKRRVPVLLTALLLVMFSAGNVRAITVTAAPNPARTDQNVTVSITAVFVGTVFCPIEVNFGDSPVWGTAGTCGGGTCNLSANHVYPAAGTYTISARSQSCLPAPAGPDPASTVITVAPAQTLSVNVMPSSLRVPRDTASVQNIFYTLTAAVDANLQSASGAFLANGSVLGTSPVPLTAVVRGGHGTVSEALTIPVAVLQKALALRTTSLSYVRTFTDGIATVTARTDMTITTEAGSDFNVKRLRLYFDNGRSETTVKKGRPPAVHADLSFLGSGLLQGFWEVDGRSLAVVSEHLTYGGSLVLDSPLLPAFDPGAHRVRFVITSPPPIMDPPEALYYVADGAAENGKALITPVSPEDNAVLEYAATVFRWTDTGRSARYQLEVFDAADKRLVFSAQVKAPEYTLPQVILKQLFVPGGRYSWNVTGSDNAGNGTGESPQRAFSFKAQ